MNLLARLRGSHSPDALALSALADGRLAPDAARALEAHVAGCRACAARREGLRSVKSMLAAMPETEAPRSFRLRLSDVDAPVAAHAVSGGRPLRWAPALSGVAAALFVAVLAADFTSRDGDSGAADSTAARMSPRTEAQNGVAADSAEDAAETAPIAPSPAAGAIAPDLPTAEDDGAGTGGNDASIAQATCAALRSTLSTDDEREYFNQTCAAGDSLALGNDADNADDAATRAAEFQSANLEAVSDDDDGNRTGFLVVEIVAAIVAVGAAVAFFATRGRKVVGGR
jgi:hypothetical protein